MKTLFTSFIMLLVLSFLLSLAYLAKASAILASESADTADLEARASGYRSVAYFVNWVSLYNVPLG